MTVFGWCFGCERELSDWSPSDGFRHRGIDRKTLICVGPVWPGVRVRDPKEADRLIEELLSIEAPGHVLEWVPGQGAPCLVFALYDRFQTGDGRHHTRRIDWLRIAADPGGPPVDIDDVRAVVGQARAAGCRVWIERLGPLPYDLAGDSLLADGSPPVGSYLDLTDPDGADPAEWPEDLRNCRELPEPVQRGHHD